MLHRHSIRGRAAPLLWAVSLVAIMGFAPAKGAKTAKARPAAVSTHYYRDSLDTLTAPPPIFVGEVPASAARSGVLLKVEKDGAGRILRSTRLEDGKPQASVAYEYASGAKLPNRTVNYSEGVETGYRTIARDSQGRIDRYDYYTAQGVLTSYTAVTHSSGYDTYESHGPDGAALGRSEEYYDADGIETRSVLHGRDGVRTTETIYDTHTGVVTSQTVSDDGKLAFTVRFTYDPSDSLIRTDTYDPKGTPYVYSVFEHGREVRKRYNFSDGTAKEIVYAYDARHWLTGSKMSVNGQPVCTFTIEREPNGAVKRSLATGPDGSLWAEYPNLLVTEAMRDGRSAAAPGVGVIHHTGNWY